jgi:hypothetical protein
MAQSKPLVSVLVPIELLAMSAPKELMAWL